MSSPITPDERAAMRETIATLDAAWEADDPARPLVTEHAALALLAQVASAVPRLLDALDTAEAERDEARTAIARRRALWEHERAKWSDALAFDRRDRDEARAEVARLRAATSPAWDEDTVTEDMARAAHDAFCDAEEEDTPETGWSRWDEASHHRRDVARRQVAAVLDVVQEHLPVFAADIDGLAFAIFEHSHEPSLPDDQGGMEEARSRALDYIQTYVEQGESRAQVEATALRDAADEAEATDADALVAGCAAPVSGERGRQSVIDAARAMCEEPWTWLRARADRLEGGTTP